MAFHFGWLVRASGGGRWRRPPTYRITLRTSTASVVRPPGQGAAAGGGTGYEVRRPDQPCLLAILTVGVVTFTSAMHFFLPPRPYFPQVAAAGGGTGYEVRRPEVLTAAALIRELSAANDRVGRK